MARTKRDPSPAERAQEMAWDIVGDGDIFFQQKLRAGLTGLLCHAITQTAEKPVRETTAERRRKIKAARKVTRPKRR